MDSNEENKPKGMFYDADNIEDQELRKKQMEVLLPPPLPKEEIEENSEEEAK